MSAECGTLVVPEERSKSGSGTSRMSVAIIPATARKPAPDPIVYVHGGPGSSAIMEAHELADTAHLNSDRDLILMSQRGDLHSQPELTCPEISHFDARAVGLDLAAESTKALRTKAAEACKQRLESEGADLAAYNTTESAADLNDLRKALRIRKWNVMGHSYGTQLTLTYLRMYPKAIRSVVLDGVVPPDQASFGLLWRAVGEGFHGLVRACETQPACDKRYPKLDATFTRLVREAESKPVTTTVKVEGVKRPVKVVLDPSTLVSWLVIASHRAADAPKAIDEMAHGRPQTLAEQWAAGKADPKGFGIFAWGLLDSTTCAEWEQGTAEEVKEGKRAFPGLSESTWEQVPQVPFHKQDCPVWNVPKAPSSLRQPTHSDLPVLVMNGSLDAQTAASNGAHVARTLPNSTNVIVPGQAHGTFFESKCAADVIVSFFNHPDKPDTACVAKEKPVAFNLK
jgi:pimeloyl-ACP methyl ester carboxylesterase